MEFAVALFEVDPAAVRVEQLVHREVASSLSPHDQPERLATLAARSGCAVAPGQNVHELLRYLAVVLEPVSEPVPVRLAQRLGLVHHAR